MGFPFLSLKGVVTMWAHAEHFRVFHSSRCGHTADTGCPAGRLLCGIRAERGQKSEKFLPGRIDVGSGSGRLRVWRRIRVGASSKLPVAVLRVPASGFGSKAGDGCRRLRRGARGAGGWRSFHLGRWGRVSRSFGGAICGYCPGARVCCGRCGWLFSHRNRNSRRIPVCMYIYLSYLRKKEECVLLLLRMLRSEILSRVGVLFVLCSICFRVSRDPLVGVPFLK